MKRILTFLLAAALLLTSLSCALSASAAAESSDWMTKLTNKTLIQVVEKEIGKGWTLYQPNPREEDTKTSSNSFLKNVKLYPRGGAERRRDAADYPQKGQGQMESGRLQ